MIHMATDPLGARAATHGLPHLSRAAVAPKPRRSSLAGNSASLARQRAAVGNRPR